MSLRVASAGGTATGEEGRRRLARPRSVIRGGALLRWAPDSGPRNSGPARRSPCLVERGVGDGPEVRTRAARPAAALPTTALSSWVPHEM